MIPGRCFILVTLLVAAGCGRDSDQINCDDLLSPAETSYAALAQIVTNTDDPRNCASCHNSSEPLYGLDFETPGSAYFTMRDGIDRVYAQVASGSMPDDGLRWDDDDLRLLRSWYCYGALHD